MVKLRRALSALVVSGASVSLAVFVTWTFVTGGANPFVKAQPTPIPVPTKHVNLQGGVIVPRWGQDAYGSVDHGYIKALSEIQQQTGANWVEVTFTLYQQDITSTQVYRGESSTSPENLGAGIATARAAGYHVYVVPALTLESTDWAGLIDFSTHESAQQWFDNYDLALTPYLQAAAQAGADQFSIGNELDNLDKHWPDLWNQLLDRVHATFSGALTYNFNFNSAYSLPYPWMTNSHLTYLGVSEYQSLVDDPTKSLSVSQMESVWQVSILPQLDRISVQLGKQILISEIGYRNATDALYQPWVHSTRAPEDATLQAAAYEAAMIEVYSDPHFAGIFFWAWSVPPFAPNWQPASRVLRAWYANDKQPPPCNALLPLLQC
jgi:hypothetical protein